MPVVYKDKLILLAAVRNRENAALEYLYREYYTMICSYVIKNNGSEDDARDIFQEVLLILYKKLNEDLHFVLNVEISTYLYAIAQNLWRSNLRKKNSKMEIDELNNLSDSIEDINNQEELVETEKKYDTVANVLKSMKKECREIIEAAFYKRLSAADIAQLMGYTESFVKVKKFNALKNLEKR